MVAGTLATVAFISGISTLARFTTNERSEPAIESRLFGHHYDAPLPALSFVVTATSLNPVERRLHYHFGAATVSYPLAHVLSPSDSLEARKVTASIPSDFDPSQFPNDTHAFDLRVNAYLPKGLGAAVPDASGMPLDVVSRYELPVDFGIALDKRLGQWDLDTDAFIAGGRETSPAGGSPYYAARMKIELGRGWTYWAFIYSVSLMPAVIGLSFFVRIRHRLGTSDTSAAMELAAALLALIALRQVFVPTDIVALTRLDFLLGVQLLVVCWLMAVTYVAEPRAPAPPKRKPRPRSRRLIPRLPAGAVRR